MREPIVRETRTWIGTPYHHQQSEKGCGCDCLGLVRGVWRAVIGPEPETLPVYSSDWTIGDELLLKGTRRHLVERPVAEIEAGDVVVFRMRRGRPSKHCGIVVTASEGWAFVHAWDAVPAICETALDDWWRRRITAAFSFPGAA